jgi:Rod binding domain-containing protein
MTGVNLGVLAAGLPVEAPLPGGTRGAREAARDFEALLIGQLLKSAREGGGWLGAEDQTALCAMEFAEQQLAGLLAQAGGLGLAGLIEQGLERQQQAADTAAAARP